MLMEQLRAVANAVLYEGYMLYPYRPSALKNQRRGWSFGALLPPAYAAANPGESCEIRSQVLASAAPAAEFSIEARFLQLSSPSLAEQAVDGIVERSIIARATLASLLDQCQQLPFTFPTLLNTTIEGLL